jgi:hypothetical protein
MKTTRKTRKTPAKKKGEKPEEVSDIIGKEANKVRSKPQLYETNYNKRKQAS